MSDENKRILKLYFMVGGALVVIPIFLAAAALPGSIGSTWLSRGMILLGIWGFIGIALKLRQIEEA